MDYKDLEVIWSSQQTNPVFSVNHVTLSDRLHRETTQSVRSSFWMWVFYQALALFMFLMLIAEPIFEHHDYYQIPLAIVFLGLFVYLFKIRPKKRDGALVSQSSIRANLEASLKQATFDFVWYKGVSWWVFATFLITMVSTFVIFYGSKPIWIWIATVIAWGFWIAAIRRDINQKSERITDLQSLRDQLVKADQG